MRVVLYVSIVLLLVSSPLASLGWGEETDVPEESGSARSTWDAGTTVGRVVAEVPETARVLELVGIDYCCGGDQTLADAASARKLDVSRLLAALLVVGPAKNVVPKRSFLLTPLPEVLDHIEGTHHAFLKRELPRLREIVATVARVHGERHSELLVVKRLYDALADELEDHLRAEEEDVFPKIRRAAQGEKVGELAGLLAELEKEHDAAGEVIHRLRAVTADYAVPGDACRMYRQMLAGFVELERDMLAHVHLENSVVLPRARALLEPSK